MATKLPQERKRRYDVSSSPLYSIGSKRRLAEVIGWTGPPSQLGAFSRQGANYNRYYDRKKPEKPRLVEAPKPALKKFQKRIEELLKRVQMPDYLHSAVPGRSYLSNSDTHRRTSGCTVTLDVSEFFQSVTHARVTRLFIVDFRCSRDVAEILASLLCCDGHLATGSPASPIVSFLAFKDIFDTIRDRAIARGSVFTLYIDDIAVTGNGVGHTDIKWIKKILSSSQLRVNDRKTRLFPSTSAKVVTGRAFRNGESRAPNTQHRKLREAMKLLKLTPGDKSLTGSVVGRLRHLALLDTANASALRSAALALTALLKTK